MSITPKWEGILALEWVSMQPWPPIGAYPMFALPVVDGSATARAEPDGAIIFEAISPEGQTLQVASSRLTLSNDLLRLAMASTT